MAARGFLRMRKRRPDDGRYLAKDEAAWRRLVRAARECARAPLAYGRGLNLDRAGQAASRAVLPAGHRSRDSIFVRLMLEARLFWTLLDPGRMAKAPVLKDLADQVEGALAQPALRSRADLE